MAGVLCVGIATLDLVFAVGALPQRAEKYRATDLAMVGGGIAANSAVAAARLGARARLATRLGDDWIATQILGELEAEDIDCSLARRFAGVTTPLSTVLVDAEGERMLINYSDPKLPEEVDWLPGRLPDDVDAVLCDQRWEAGAFRAFEMARAESVPALLDLDRLPSRRELVAAATHAALSAQAMRELAGRDDPLEGLQGLAEGAQNWLAVTDGARGTWFTEAGTIVHEPAFAVEAVDTLGAGDVFHGALALALAEHRPERAAVRFASAAAALKCTRFGGRAGAPTREEVDRFTAAAGAGR